MDHHDNKNSKDGIPAFARDPEKFPSWMFDINLYATSTNSLDVWEGFDNPFMRQRRLEIVEMDIVPNS